MRMPKILFALTFASLAALFATQAGAQGLTLNFGAYLAELFRSGVQSIDSGQYEASRALGIRSLQRLRVIRPHDVPRPKQDDAALPAVHGA